MERPTKPGGKRKVPSVTAGGRARPGEAFFEGFRDVCAWKLEEVQKGIRKVNAEMTGEQKPSDMLEMPKVRERRLISEKRGLLLQERNFFALERIVKELEGAWRSPYETMYKRIYTAFENYVEMLEETLVGESFKGIPENEINAHREETVSALYNELRRIEEMTAKRALAGVRMFSNINKSIARLNRWITVRFELPAKHRTG